MNSSRLGLGFIALVAIATAAVGFARSDAGPAAAPVAPAAVAQAPSPPPATPAPKKKGGPSKATPEPTETPEPPQFSSLDGVWEVQVQPLAQRRTLYSHLNLVQTGTAVAGTWDRDGGKILYKLTGTFDGRLFALTIDLGGGKSASMNGYAENFSDFVGMLQFGNDPGTAMTAQHRKKERPG